MPSSESAAFQDHFQDLNDPRVERTRKHPLIIILFIAVCGVLSGANSFAAIEEFGLDRRTWFARYLDLTNGIPSDDTFARVLARLDPGAFEKCLLSWMQAVQEITDQRLIAIDGKTLRGSYDRQSGKAAIHMVSAWASENKLSLGQVVVDEKSNEITAIPALLQVLDVSGGVVITSWPSSRTNRRCMSRWKRRSASGWSRTPPLWTSTGRSRRATAVRR